MNKLALQLFLVLAFIPIAILISSIIITLAPFIAGVLQSMHIVLVIPKSYIFG